jgi:hypothetical protein
VVAIDSLFDAVAAASPDCAPETSDWRQQKPYIDLLTASIAAMQAQQFDSAAALAEKSLLLYDKSPFAYQVLASVAHQKKEVPKQVSNWKRVLETAEGDTAYAEMQRQAWMYLGDIYATQADAAADASAKLQLAKQSSEMYRAFLAVAPTDPNAPAIRSNLSLVLRMAGDTASIPTIYADHLANPAKYSTADLFSAGTIAGQANRSADAIQLFESALKGAPYHRDALYNLTVSLLSEKKYAEMIPVAQRLVAVDPGKKDNWSFIAYAYHSLQAAAPANTPQKKALTDSIVKYSAIGDSLKYDVTVETFSPRDSSASIGGTIQNLDEKAPQTVRIKVEFLNNQGVTVATKEETVAAIPAKGSASFAVQNQPGVGIVAWKYSIPK